MSDDQTFRTVLVVGSLVLFPIAGYHRLKAHATGEKLDRRLEGLFILFTLRPLGIAAMLGLVAYMVDPSWMAWSSVALPTWLRWTGVAVGLIAGGLLTWTLRSLGKNLTDTVVTRREHTLVTTGPYRWVRHPFYDSVALCILANSLAAANWFLFSTGGLAVVLMIVRTRTEEALLLERFGDSYRAYLGRTGRFLPRTVIFLAALLAFGATSTSHPAAQQEERALAVAREVERLAARRVLWPGFDPMAIPLAVYVGERTYLFRHPAPPEGFSPIPSAEPAASAYQGRHPAVTSNSSAEIGGTVTATLLADDSRAGQTPSELAAVALHEAFHVFQRRRHPGWSGNEGDLLLYPTENARLLTLRRLETEAFRRALAESARAGAACWTRRALALRSERFAGLEPAFVAYERQTELNEGLATYIQLAVAGRMVKIPAGEFAASEVRHRVYAVGPALALLLDRFRPGWPATLETDDRQHLDAVLGAAVGGRRPDVPDACAFTAVEVADAERVAARDAAAVLADRTERRRSFDARSGWRVVVKAADGQPLWPQGFDPLNLERVEGGLLHTRFLRLENEMAQLAAVDGQGADLEALTSGVGPHPLFSGIQRVVIAGLAKPEVETQSGRVVLRAPGLTGKFENASVRESGTEVLIELH